MKSLGWILLLIFALSGCGGGTEKEDEKFAQEDMGIIKTASGEKVHFGMKRADAEKVLGEGKDAGKGRWEYEPGILVFYRNDTVAMITLEEKTQGQYQTTRGAEIGMRLEQIRNLYGENDIPDPSGANLNYIYDFNKGEFLDEYPSVTDEKTKDTVVFSTMFDSNGQADALIMIDVYFQNHGE